MSLPLLRINIRLGILLTLLALVAYAKWGCYFNQGLVLASTPRDFASLCALQARAQAAAKNVLPAIVAVKTATAPADFKPRIYQPYCSGVIITADGLVLSQFHVSHRLSWKPGEPVRSLQPGDRSTVILSDGRKVEAELLGADQDWELSLLRLLEPGPYPHIAVAPDARVELGDWVLKLGHPLGYRSDRPTVVRLGRVLYQDDERFVTDCNTDGGDSGGPLVDLEGRFVGMIGSSDIPSKLQNVMVLQPNRIFNCTSSPVVYRCLPSMLSGKISAGDRTGSDDRNRRFQTTPDTLPALQWTQGQTTALPFRKIVGPATSGVVEILNESDTQEVLGTIVDADGWILTAASLLPPQPKCRLFDGRVLPAEVIGVNPAYDLALLKVTASNLRPVEWAPNPSTKIAGTLLAAPAFSSTQDGLLLAMGIVSVPTRDLPGPFPKRLERPKLHADPPSLFGTPSDEGYRLDSPDVQAENAGIRSGDLHVSIDDKPIQSDEDVWDSAKGHAPGEHVGVRVLRAGKPLEFSLMLNAEPLISSKPFADFPTFFEHDMPLPLSQCGGPVIDLDGKAVGITMYRGSYGCMAIPADRLQQLLPELKSGNLAEYWDQHNSAVAVP